VFVGGGTEDGLDIDMLTVDDARQNPDRDER